MKNNKWIYYILIVIFIVAFVLLCANKAKGIYISLEHPHWTNKMLIAHEAADVLRSYGYSDDSEAIKALSDIWWKEYYDTRMIARTIQGEAGACEWLHKVYVGAVIVNRVESSLFPDTVYDVLMQPGQYTPLYTYDFNYISEECWEAAVWCMNEYDDAPDDLYWQAEFIQGKEVWKTFVFDSDYYHSVTYFCRGTIYD